MEEVLKQTREWIDGVAHRVDVSIDGRFRLDFGKHSDQRPDPNGVSVFAPVRVKEVHYVEGSNLFDTVDFCGKCRMRIGKSWETREFFFCPRCGVRVAYRHWDEVDHKWKSKDCLDRLPDYWPLTIDGSDFDSALEGAMLLSDGTAADPELSGSGCVSTETLFLATAETTFAKDGR